MNKLPILFIVFFTLASCAKDSPSALPEESDGLIRWGVESVAGYPTKSLVENVDYLQRACTPEGTVYKTEADGTEVKGLGQTLGIWADYSIDIDGVKHEVSNVFAETKLVYNPQSTDQYTSWEYASDPAYWVMGGEYVFRAYYPKNELNVSTKLSNAKSLVIEMNTATTQRDMLLAHQKIDTKASGFTITAPVNMNFRHAMSAMMFKFKFYDGEDGILYTDDAITSCWMEVDEDDSFAITGFMIYGNGTNYDEGLVQWRNQYFPAKGIAFYRWGCSQGVPFSNARPAEGEDWNPAKHQTVATAYTVKGTGLNDNGVVFLNQNGWIVTIPQKSNGKLALCFKTKTGGNAVFRVNIPATTGTSLEKYNADPNDLEAQKDPAGTDWIPGYRYTYTISISKTDASVNLSIAPWRRMDSSFNIKF